MGDKSAISWTNSSWNPVTGCSRVSPGCEPRLIFVNSMSDLFHEQVPDEFIARVFAVMELNTQHTFQVLTKRAARMRDWCTAHAPMSRNVWLGVSTEDQRRADERIPLLLDIPREEGHVRFISAEPLLEGLAIWRFLGGRDGLNWVIDGGESGAGFRPASTDWFRGLRDKCRVAGVPYFHKQGSALRPGQHVELDGQIWHQLPGGVQA